MKLVDTPDLNGDGKTDVIIYNTANGAAYTGISTGNPGNPFTYQYSYWGNETVKFGRSEFVEDSKFTAAKLDRKVPLRHIIGRRYFASSLCWLFR